GRRAAQAVQAQRLRVSRAGAARQAGAGRARAQAPRHRRDPGHAPRVPARSAGRPGAGGGGLRRQRPRGARVLEQRAAARPRGRAPRGERRDRPGALENRAVSFPYEPGSTFKAITVAGALQTGLITPNSGFAVADHIRVADRTIHDDTEHAEESLTTAEILAQSSNVGAIEIGMLEGAPRFAAWVRQFGFGAKTGVELPGEEMGAVLPLDSYSGS